MTDVIPEPKPRGTYHEDADRITYRCTVPGCGHVDTSDAKAQLYRRARQHREQHRTALHSGGGSQLTVFDALDSLPPTSNRQENK